METLLKKIEDKVNQKTDQFLRVLFIESTDEIVEAKSILKKNKNLFIFELDYFNTKKIQDECATVWYQKRKHKGMTLDAAKQIIKNKLDFAVALVYLKYVDVLVVGAELSSKTCFSSILKLLKKDTNNFASSTMAMFKNNNLIFMSDCALNLSLNNNELLDVAKHSQKIAENYFDVKNNYHAYISYISDNYFQNKINGEINIVGPMQFDSVVDIKTRIKKLPNVHKEKINHFLFDNIATANTVFKIYQKELGYKTIGSFVSNLDYRVSVISRSADVHEILLTTYFMLYAFLVDKQKS